METELTDSRGSDPEVGVAAVSRHEAKYRIRAVAERTGVPAATLRAWERRYGVPDPGRSESAYRLYSDRDITMVLRVRELCEGGMSPSRAAAVVRERGLGEPEVGDVAPDRGSSADPYARTCEAIVRAVRRFDPEAVELAVQRAIALGSATTVTDRVFVPAMRRIGDLWHAGDIGVGEEHMATQIVHGAATAMLRLIQPEHAHRTVLLACLADEEHTLATLGVAMHLASWGHRVVRLGARTPPPAIGAAVARLRPNLVALSVTVAPEPDRARELVEAYARACGSTPWVVGGRGAEALSAFVVSHGGNVLAASEGGHLRGALEGLMAHRRQLRR